MKEKEFCLKGWNWGVANFVGSSMNFDIDKATAFEVPLSNVSHCTSAKNEVTIEFHQNDDAAVSLMELRFHIPNPADPTADDPVQSFVENVMAKADIIQATGDAIVTFSELHCLTPRGRYDIKLFPSFIQLHGKTFDYKIPLTTVLRLFRLPHRDGRQVYFVLSLDPPIKQGQTRYHFLILNFNKDDDHISKTLNIGEDSEEKFRGMDREIEGSAVDVIGKVMKALVQRKVTTPSEDFCGKFQLPVITCSYKSDVGSLYPLDRGFIFVHKPPIHIRFEEIAAVNFARGSGTTRSFDFEVETKAGLVHTFSSIEKEEYGKLFDFVTSKKLRVKNTGAPAAKDTGDDDDLIDSDQDDDHDAYLQRVKAEGKRRDEDGDSDESDESFNPDKAVGSDDSGSDVAEEYDSEISGSESGTGSDDSSSKKKKKEKKKSKKEPKKSKEKEPKKPKEKEPKKKRDKKEKPAKETKKTKKETTSSPSKKDFKSKEFVEDSSDSGSD